LGDASPSSRESAARARTLISESLASIVSYARAFHAQRVNDAQEQLPA
jgi:hypothetical protein